MYAFPRFKNDDIISSKIIIVLLFCSYVFSGEGGGLQQEFVRVHTVMKSHEKSWNLKMHFPGLEKS